MTSLVSEETYCGPECEERARVTQKAWSVGAGLLKSGALGCCLPGMRCVPLALFPHL